MKKKGIKIFIVLAAIIGFAIFMMLGTIVYLSQFHIDLSQEYRKVKGYENIVFKDSWNEQCFELCFWGLKKAETYTEFQDNRNYDTQSYEYMTLINKTDVNSGNLRQVTLSPDKNYILYVESIYRGTGLTDDEDLYYKVYSIKDDSVIVIYSGYRQFSARNLSAV